MTEDSTEEPEASRSADPDPDPDQQDPTSTARLVELLERVPELERRARLAMHTSVRVGSFAEVDARHPLGHHAGILASQSAMAALEHLSIWQSLFTRARVQPIGAHLTLLRGSIEPAVTCRWLVGASAGGVERVRRGASLLVPTTLTDGTSRPTWDSAATTRRRRQSPATID